MAQLQAGIAQVEPAGQTGSPAAFLDLGMLTHSLCHSPHTLPQPEETAHITSAIPCQTPAMQSAQTGICLLLQGLVQVSKASSVQQPSLQTDLHCTAGICMVLLR